MAKKRRNGFRIIINTDKGSVVIGSTFVGLFLLMLMLTGYMLAGGALPTAFIRNDTASDIRSIHLSRLTGTPKPMPCTSPAVKLTEVEGLYAYNPKAEQQHIFPLL